MRNLSRTALGFAGAAILGFGALAFMEKLQRHPRHLIEAFRRCYGVPPHTYLLQRRVREAKRRLLRYFLRRLDPSIAGRIMGSQGKRDAVMRGMTPEAVVNSGRDPAYWVKTVGEVAR